MHAASGSVEAMIERVLPSCRRVAETARLVTIDEVALPRFAERIAPLLPEAMTHTPHHFAGDVEQTVGYFLVLDALNFGSGFFAHYRSYRGEKGYFALATALRDWFAERGAPTPAALQAIDAAEMSHILGQDPASAPLRPFIGWAVEALRELGHFIETDLNGRCANMLTYGNHQADDMVALLCRMPMFRDVSHLAGEEVWLLKRAQILVHDTAIAGAERGLFEIHGLDRLTVFADNMLPFVLEANGVLRYHPALSHRIGRGETLRPGSRAEIELRAVSVHVCELLRLELAQRGVIATARAIDFALWNAGVATPERGDHRLHLCQTWFY
ncbi:MAG: hypothetical protein JWL96_1511 [Sphingomonas bacterium]|uniref:queuosine salvage family protein n=1 Tax=Sphingomonas bacterium TaxID=1895847 RepID=UPI00261DA4E5|nr:queuosine salvage family protein [Sphingomonas bacterium]MDB5709441.1 hypothetical protein [Sphingomonas bacterium]